MSEKKFHNVGVVILAAGKGTRLGYTNTPKVMLEIGGKPIVEHVVKKLEHIGFDRDQICLVVGFQKEKVKEYFVDRVIYADQDEQLGTGHAVLMSEQVLKNKFEHIVVLYGDMPFLNEESIEKIIAEHFEKKNTLTLTTIIVPHFEDEFEFFKDSGRIVRGSDGNIIADVELKDITTEYEDIRELNVGYYCFQSDWLWDRLSKLGSNNAQGEIYLTDLIEVAVDEGVAISSVVLDSGEALGINTAQDLEEANKKIIK